MVFTEAELFEECERKLRSVTSTSAIRRDAFASTWASLQSWARHELGLFRGCALPSLAKFMIRQDKQVDGSVLAEPLFVVSDAFVRGCTLHPGAGVTRQASVSSNDQVQACSEINFIKLSIK